MPTEFIVTVDTSKIDVNVAETIASSLLSAVVDMLLESDIEVFSISRLVRAIDQPITRV